MEWYLKLFGTPCFYHFHKALYRFASRTIGIGNFSWNTSGEKFFIDHLLPKKSKMVVFDVGAFHGEYSEFFKKQHFDATIFAFEPQPKAFKYLQKRADSLGFQVFNFGMGNKEEEREFYTPPRSPAGSAIGTLISDVLDQHFKMKKNSQIISIKTIDQFCEKHEISQIDLLKIDAEGFEYEILQGAYKMISTFRIDFIQFEFNVMSIFHRRFLRDFMDLLPFYTFYRLLPKGMVRLEPNNTEEIMEFQNVIAWRTDLQ